MKLSRFYKLWFLLGLFLLLVQQVKAQSVLTPHSMSMGGGGVTYLSGYSSNFINPANLLIPDHHFETQIGIGQIGLIFNDKPAFSHKNFLHELYNSFSPQSNNIIAASPTLNTDQLAQIQSSWFPDNRITHRIKTEFNALLFGISWQHHNHAFSLAVRTRGINSAQINRGWYDPNFVKMDSLSVINRDVSQKIAVFHEISFGFAQELSLVNGWSSQLNRLYFGIAPKFIIGGMYFNGQYNSEYIQNKSGISNVRSFNSVSTGALSNNLAQYNASAGQFTYPPNTLTSTDFEKPTGYGMGLDMGFTYIMALGNDVALLRGTNDPVLKKSFRLSVSMTDIGFINYTKNVKQYESSTSKGNVSQVPAISNVGFNNSPGMFSRFIASDDINGTSYNSSNLSNKSQLAVPLPTALHVGSAIQLPRILAAVDFTYGLNHQSFNSEHLITNIGAELRLLPFLPIRAGVQFEKGYDTIIGAGTALSFPHFEISFGTQINAPGVNHKTYLISAGVTAIKLRF